MCKTKELGYKLTEETGTNTELFDKLAIEKLANGEMNSGCLSALNLSNGKRCMCDSKKESK